MLITCKECGQTVSDKAAFCPHCGYTGKVRAAAPKQHRRLPNGFGRITRITNQNLRNPYRVLITTGHDENGKPIASLLKPKAYFQTYNDAYAALMEYHKNPIKYGYQYTVRELYEEWMAIKVKELTPGSVAMTQSRWKYCAPLYDRQVADLQTWEISECIENGRLVTSYNKVLTPSRTTKQLIKSIWVRMLDYAIARGIISANCAKAIKIANPKEERKDVRHHISYTDEEMAILWANVNVPGVDIILIQCYSGWRPQELCQLKTADANVVNWTFTGGIKTEAGINRTVPIHSCIRSLVKRQYDYAVEKGGETLLSNRLLARGSKRIPLSYEILKRIMANIKEDLGIGLDHRPHDGRKQFVTMAKKAGVNDYAIKRIVGHAIKDLTEDVYTDRDVEWLRAEMEKIEGPKQIS